MLTEPRQRSTDDCSGTYSVHRWHQKCIVVQGGGGCGVTGVVCSHNGQRFNGFGWEITVLWVTVEGWSHFQRYHRGHNLLRVGGGMQSAMLTKECGEARDSHVSA